MKKIMIGCCCTFFGLLVHTASADVKIGSKGWSIEAPPAYKDAYLFVKINNSYQALPHYKGNAIVIRSQKYNQPIHIQDIAIKMHNTVLGTTCKNLMIHSNQKLEVSGKIIIHPHTTRVDFSNFNCKIRTLS